jgi:hypothetical protein
MSEARRRLEKTTETRKKAEKSYSDFPYSPPTHEDADRINELRRQEERIKELIKHKMAEQRKIIISVIEILRKAAVDEDTDAIKYKEWSSRFAGIRTPMPTVQNILNTISNEEEHHARYLRSLISRLEDTLEK